MIKTFASKETEKLFQREASRVLPTDIQRKTRQKLDNPRRGGKTGRSESPAWQQTGKVKR